MTREKLKELLLHAKKMEDECDLAHKRKCEAKNPDAAVDAAVDYKISLMVFARAKVNADNALEEYAKKLGKI